MWRHTFVENFSYRSICVAGVTVMPVGYVTWGIKPLPQRDGKLDLSCYQGGSRIGRKGSSNGGAIHRPPRWRWFWQVGPVAAGGGSISSI